MIKRDELPEKQYGPAGTIPQKIRKGMALMHNHVGHTKNTGQGDRGFRWWTDTRKPEHFILCKCGWSGLPHYSRDGA